jgi:two-component system, cell cycle sensor histidine kinase and response regulator CckA
MSPGAKASMEGDRIEPSSAWLSPAIRAVLFAVSYFAGAVVSFELSHAVKIAIQFWLPSGLFLGALLANPPRRWPGFVAAAAVADLAYTAITPAVWPLSVWIQLFAGNAASALLGAWLVRTFVSKRPSLISVRDLVGIVVLGGVVAQLACAAIGASALSWRMGQGDFATNFAGWYSSDLLGVVMFTPTVITWRRLLYNGEIGLDRRLLELLLIGLSVVAAIAFTYYFHLLRSTDVLFVAFPLITWAAIRTGLPGATIAVFIATLTVDWFVARGYASGGIEALGERRHMVENVLSQVVFAFVGLIPATVFSSLRAARSREQLRTQTMTLLATGARLPQVLDSIILGVQSEDPTMICAIMVTDQTGKFLLVASAPGLPDAYIQKLNGLKVGPDSGSCGTAAYSNRRVVTEDVELDPRWECFRDAARQAQLRSCWSQPITDSSGHVAGTFSVYHRFPLLPSADEIQLIDAACALAAIACERKQLEERLLRRQRLESIGRLAGGIAHDLNNLLTPITVCTSFLKQTSPRTEDRELLESIDSSAKRGAELVRQVLTFARGVEGSKIALNLQLVVQEIESIAAKTFPKNISFAYDLPPGLPLVSGDRTQLGQVLMNLCLNARDAMPSGGSIRVSGYARRVDEETAALYPGVQPGRFVVLEVVDDGTGMTADVVDRIFEPFFTTKETGRGTGLGLSTAMGIVRSHGGFMDVTSAPGKGSVFRIAIPAIDGDPSVGLEPVSPAPVARGSGQWVLLVDDEPAVLKATARVLELFGYRVLSSSEGAAALELFEAHASEVAAAVTDLMMPGMDGNELVRRLRLGRPGLPIVTVSGLRPESAVPVDGKWVHLSKPFTPEQVAEAVGALLSRA